MIRAQSFARRRERSTTVAFSTLTQIEVERELAITERSVFSCKPFQATRPGNSLGRTDLALKKNNNRAWFAPLKELYERACLARSWLARSFPMATLPTPD